MVACRICASRACRRCGGRPPRGASRSIPANRRTAKRWRHNPTVCRLVWTAVAMSWLSCPAAATRMIFARSASRTGVRRPLAQRSHCGYSSSVTCRCGARRMVITSVRTVITTDHDTSRHLCSTALAPIARDPAVWSIWSIWSAWCLWLKKAHARTVRDRMLNRARHLIN